MSSRGISSIVTTETTSAKNVSFNLAKSWGFCLDFDVVAFHLTNFMHSERCYVRELLKVMWPPNSATCVGHYDIRIPRAASTTTDAVTVLPCSHVFKKYSSSWFSKSPRRQVNHFSWMEEWLLLHLNSLPEDASSMSSSSSSWMISHAHRNV